MTRVPVRDDLQALEGYHSPQVSVAVRLNTNESPEPPPAAWRDALAAELARVEWHRYPDRSARDLRDAIGALHGVPAEQVFAANGSNEVLQTLLLTFAGPGRTVATFEPTYQLHAHIARLTGATVVEGERRADFTLDLPAATRVLAESRPAVTFLCSPNNPTGLVEPEATVRALLDEVPGLLVVDEAYAAVRAMVGAVPGRGGPSARRDPHLLQDLVDGRRPAGLPRRAGLAGHGAGEGGAPVPPRHHQADRRAPRPGLRGRDGDPGEAGGGRAGADRERPCRTLPVETWPSGANFILFRPRERDGRAVWQGLLDRSVLVRDCSGWPRLVGLPAGDGRDAGRERRVRRRARRGAGGRRRGIGMTARTATRQRVTKETAIELFLDLDGRGDTAISTGLPFYDHMLDQLGRHGGFDLTVKAEGDLHIDSHHTVEDVAIALGEAFREALGDKAGVRRFASGLYPLDEALVEVALDLSGRPVRGVGGRAAGVPPARQSAVRPAAGRARRAQLRHRGRHHPARDAATRAATSTTSSRRRSRGWRAACATPCASRAPGSRPPRGCCDERRPAAPAGRGARLRDRQPALGREGADPRRGRRSAHGRPRTHRAPPTLWCCRAWVRSAGAWRRCEGRGWRSRRSPPSTPGGRSSASASACRCSSSRPRRTPPWTGSACCPGGWCGSPPA